MTKHKNQTLKNNGFETIEKTTSITAMTLDDSMLPALPRKSILYLSSKMEVKKGDVVAIQLKSGVNLVRRFVGKGKKITSLTADNKNYKATRVKNNEIKNMHKVWMANIRL